MIMNSEPERRGDEVLVASFRALSQYSPERTERKHSIPCSA